MADDIAPCIILHHGGHWQSDTEYVGGQVKVFNELDVDFDGTYLKTLFNSLGYSNVIKLHYCDPLKNLSNGVRVLGYDDITFTKFKSLLFEYKIIDLFTEHDTENRQWFNIGSGNGYVSKKKGKELLQTELEDSEHCKPPLLSNLTQTDYSLHGENIGLWDEIDYDEEGSDNDDVELKDARAKLKEDADLEYQFTQEIESLNRLAERSGDYPFETNSDEDDESNSDLDSPPQSDTEDDCGYLLPKPKKSKPDKPKFNLNKPLRGRAEIQSPFYLGQEFENAVALRSAITSYCVSVGRDVQYTRNDKKRIGAKCKGQDCKWYLWASLEGGTGTMTVKTHYPDHNCGRVAKVRKIRASWISKHYHSKFNVNPYLKCQEIVDTVWADWGVKISLWMALKARRLAQKLILGEYKEQYSLLHRYAQEILRSNPHNTIKFKLNNNVFERVYVCFAALKKGFVAGCRPFFGLDGCFLKGPFGGQLLVAVGRDGNNQMFPIAWACVQIENTETWTWFLELLADDLGTVDGHGYTIMSDQQKGLLRAVSDIWPSAETRVCARHVYCNFRQVFGGSLEYRLGFWRIAKSTTENRFQRNWELFNKISATAGQDLLKRNYKKWVRAFFTSQSTCDVIDNSMNEVFNAYILSSRHKPIITMLEDIRESLMERLHKKRDYIGNKDITICPRIKTRLEKSKIDARGWSAFWDGHYCYGVREGATHTRYVVSLLDKTCSCNAWQLSGVPCHHAVAAIWKAVEHPEHYVSDWFSKDTYLKAYAFPLEPLNGPQQWPESPYEPIQAPPVKKIQNRPATKRKPSLGEVEGTKLSKKGQTHKCSNCSQQGHNKLKCPMPLKDPGPPKSGKRKQAQHPPNEGTPTTQQSQVNLPMHQRGVGVYTYPNGYMRTAQHVHTTQPSQSQSKTGSTTTTVRMY